MRVSISTVSVIAVPGFRVVEEFDVIPDHPDRPDNGGSWVDDVVAPAAGGVHYVSRADRGLHRGRADSEQVVYASCPQGTERNRF